MFHPYPPTTALKSWTEPADCTGKPPATLPDEDDIHCFPTILRTEIATTSKYLSNFHFRRRPSKSPMFMRVVQGPEMVLAYCPIIRLYLFQGHPEPKY